MKIATYSLQGVENVGVLTPGGDALCPLGAFGYECGDMLQAIRLLDRGEVSRLAARLAGGAALSTRPCAAARPSRPSIFPSGSAGRWTRKPLWTATRTW